MSKKDPPLYQHVVGRFFGLGYDPNKPLPPDKSTAEKVIGFVVIVAMAAGWVWHLRSGG